MDWYRTRQTRLIWYQSMIGVCCDPNGEMILLGNYSSAQTWTHRAVCTHTKQQLVHTRNNWLHVEITCHDSSYTHRWRRLMLPPSTASWWQHWATNWNVSDVTDVGKPSRYQPSLEITLLIYIDGPRTLYIPAYINILIYILVYHYIDIIYKDIYIQGYISI